MSCANDNLTAKLAIERSDNHKPDASSSVAPSSAGDAATGTEDGTPAGDDQVGPWTGWAEVENDPVMLSMFCPRPECGS